MTFESQAQLLAANTRSSRAPRFDACYASIGRRRNGHAGRKSREELQALYDAGRCLAPTPLTVENDSTMEAAVARVLAWLRETGNS